MGGRLPCHHDLVTPQLETPCGPVHYTVSGPTDSGHRDLVLIHGWCCDSSVMEPLRARLSNRHRVLTLDLRGHGTSLEWDDDGSAGAGGRRTDLDQVVPSGLRAATIDDYAQDVLRATRAVGLRAPILVGHSMGALVALQAARGDGPMAPHHAAGIVALDPAPMADPRADNFWAQTAQEVSKDFSGRWRRNFVHGLFPEYAAVGAHPERDRIADLMASHPVPVAAGAARAMARFDGAAALRELHTPVLRVESGPAEDVSEHLATPELWAEARVVGSGHFSQVEVPDQVCAMMNRWLTVGGLQGY